MTTTPFTPSGTAPTHSPHGAAPSPPPPAVPTGLATVMVLLATGAVVTALLGPLGLDVIRYHVSEGASAQAAGGDLAALLLVAPSSLAAAWLLRRGRSAGAALALAPAGYSVYTYTQLASGGDVQRYDGTSQRWFPLLLGLVVLGGVALALGGRAVLREGLTPQPLPLRRVTAWFLLAVAVFLVLGLHLPGLVDAWRDEPTGAEYLADPGLFWLVKVMDLGVVVPVLVGVGVGLLRHRPWAARLRAPVVGWCALLGGAVASMAVVMLATGAAGASWGLTVGFVVVALAALALAVWSYRPLLAQDPEPGAARR